MKIKQIFCKHRNTYYIPNEGVWFDGKKWNGNPIKGVKCADCGKELEPDK